MNQQPSFVFAPGAGAPSSSAWMQRWAARLASLGEVFPFDYGYQKAGRKMPDRPPVLIAAHREATAAALAKNQHRPLVLAGKSMGSRIGCHLAVELTKEGRPPGALVCFGYPLRSGTSGALRDEVLCALDVPILFLQGSRDPLCPMADLEAVRARMRAPHQLFVVNEGDHSLEVGRRQLALDGRTQDEVDTSVLGAIRSFIDDVLSGRDMH